MTKLSDEAVKQLYVKLQEKKLAVEKAEKPNWETNGSFGFSPNSLSDRVNIQEVTDTRKLIEIYAFLLERKEKYETAATALGLENKFTWLGFTVEEWKSDLQVRVNQINLTKKRKELKELEARVNSLLSEDLKKEMEYANVKTLLETL